MSRGLSTRVYPYSFLDSQRRKYGLTMPELYHAMGWARVRYYNHCSRGVELARADVPVLARALGLSTKRVYDDEHEFYFGTRRGRGLPSENRK